MIIKDIHTYICYKKTVDIHAIFTNITKEVESKYFTLDILYISAYYVIHFYMYKFLINIRSLFISL